MKISALWGGARARLKAEPQTGDPAVRGPKRRFLCAQAVAVLLACCASSQAQLVFHSGFEAGTTIVNNDDITGVDTSVSGANDWDAPLPWGLTGVPDSNPANRLFSIVPDPAGGTNKVLKTTHFSTTTGLSKTEIGRWGAKGLWGDQLYCKFRIRLDSKFQRLETDAGYNGGFGRYVVLTEFWVKAAPNPEDRLSLRLGKKNGKLIWLFDKTSNFPPPSNPTSNPYVREWGLEGDPVQYDTWYTMELFVRLGDDSDGLAIMRYQPDGGAVREHVQFDHTVNADHPLGVINGLVACKLYTDAVTLNYLNQTAPAGVSVYYDDWEVRASYPRALPTDSRPPSNKTVLEAESFYPGAFSTTTASNFVTINKPNDLFVSKGSYVEVIGNGGGDSVTFDFSSLQSGKYRIEPVFFLKNDCSAIGADWNGQSRGTLNLNYGVTGQIAKFPLGEMQITASGPNKLTFSNIPLNERLRIDRFFVYLVSLDSPVPQTNLALWLKADEGVTANASNFVSSWKDSSSQNRDATQSTSGNQPGFQINAIGSKPAVVFDGNDVLNLASTIGGQSYTLFAVVKPAATLASHATLVGGNSGSFQWRLESGGRRQQATKTNSTVIGTSTSAVSSSLYNRLFVTYTSPNLAFRRGGTLDGTASNAQSFSAPLAFIGSKSSGGSEGFNGGIAEVLVYTGALSETDRSAVESYLASKYGL